MSSTGIRSSRQRRYAAVSLMLVAALLGGGIASRIQHDGQEVLMKAFVEKITYMRTLVKRVSY